MKTPWVKQLCIGSILSFCAISFAAQAGDTALCEKRTDLAGSCYEVHGRLNAWNGGPATEKIWVIGTRRLLAVYNRSDYSSVMPKAISEQLGSFDTKIYADFLVCPLEKEKAAA